MDNHLIGIDDFLSLARQASKHLDEKEVMRYVEECEDMYIIQAIGLDKFNDLTKSSVSSEDLILLSGGTFKNANGENEKCFGLKKALAYFVYAKMSMSDGSIITRSGNIQHNDSHAERKEQKEKVNRYDDVMNVAEEYLNSCLKYLKTLSGYEETKRVKQTRLRIKAVGD